MTKEEWDKFWEDLKVRAPSERSPLLETPQKSSGVPLPGQREVGSLLDTDSTTSHELEAERINAIKQKTSRGFKTFDINPNLLSRGDFFCVYDDFVLSNFVGSQTPVETSIRKFDNEGAPINGQPVASPYWRTVEIPFEGTYLKVEYLPVRKNDVEAIQFQTGSGVANGFTEPEVETQNSFDINYNFSSEQLILVEFENPQGRPLIARHGTAFETYYSAAYVTFKQTSARIRITVGFNSKIETQDDRPANLSIWGGRGFTTDNTCLPKQFCLTDKDVYPLTTYAGLQLPTGIPFPTVSATVLSNRGRNSKDFGVVPVWITSVECSAYYENAVTTLNSTLDVDLYKWNVSSATGQAQGSVPLERILSGQLILSQNGTGNRLNDKFCWSGEPIRFSLKYGEGLVIMVRELFRAGDVSNAVSTRIKFSVVGYSLSQIRVFQFDPPFSYPYANTFLAENPWAQDLVLNETSN